MRQLLGTGLGKYLSPEPLLQDPKWVRRNASEGLSTPTYAYALNNPVRHVDPDGRRVRLDADHDLNRFEVTLRRLNDCSCVHKFFNECYGSDPFRDGIDHWLFAYKDTSAAPWCGLGGYGFTVLGRESYVCQSAFAFGSGVSKESALGETIMHELAHQMGAGNDWLGGRGKCSAYEAQRIGLWADNGNCEAACEVMCGR